MKTKAEWAEFGNTVEFALRMLIAHWRREHREYVLGPTEGPAVVANDRDGMRVYRCEVCRGLWMRASHAWFNKHAPKAVRPVPMPYRMIVKMAISFAYSKQRPGRASV